MSRPKRIQRKRTKGWKMPEGAIYVGRPTRWGNPFDVEWHGRDLAVETFSRSVRGIWNPFHLDHLSDRMYDRMYDAHTKWYERLGGHPLELVRSELRGHDLACWCPLDQPCHADVLLELANGVTAQRDWWSNNHEAWLPSDPDQRAEHLAQLAHERAHGPAAGEETQ